MTQLTSPQGSIELAIVALLLVLGYRLTRPTGTRAWVGVIAYAAGLGGQLLGASGLIGGPVPTPGAMLRVLGAVGLVSGLVVAGGAARACRRAVPSDRPALYLPGLGATHAGLALVVAGHFLRGPSAAGLVPVILAIAVNGGLALAARRATNA